MRFILVLIAAYLTGSLMFAQTPTFTPDAPTDLETPTSTPPEIDTGTLTPPSDDLVPDAPSTQTGLVNISTRSQTSFDTVFRKIVAGFIIEGETGTSKDVVIRAIGPSLRDIDSTLFADALDNPTLDVFNVTDPQNTVTVDSNDNYTSLNSSDQTALQTTAPSRYSNIEALTYSNESGLVLNLSPGRYTARNFSADRG